MSNSSGADPGFEKGGFFYMQDCCRRQCTEVRSADQSAQSADTFNFIFQLSGWSVVAPSCFALQVPDVKGQQDPGPPCASVSCSDFAHAT